MNRRMGPGLAMVVAWVVAAWMVACQLSAQATAEPDVVVTVLNPSALPPGAMLRLFVETHNGWIVERQLDPETSAQKAVPASPGLSLMERRREGAAPSAAPMAGSDHAHSGSSREPAAPSSPAAPVPPSEAARVRVLGPLRVLIRTRTGAGSDTPAGAKLYGAVLPPSAQGVEFDGAVVLQSGGALTSVRFHAR